MKMFAAKIPAIDAAGLHRFLAEKGLLDKTRSVAREGGFVFFPVNKMGAVAKKNAEKKFGAKFVRKKLAARGKPHRSLKEYLSGRLSKKEFSLLVSSFDSLGDIAIIEIPKGLEKKEKIIAQAILELNRNFRTVCKKTAAHSGEFRVEPVKVVAGKKSLTAAYREAGCVFEISLGKVFFSPRLSTERLRIAGQIKKGEVVGALFAGVGPFPIVFAKNSPMEKAFAVELNPEAVKNLKENLRQNKVEGKIEVLEGDVRKIVPQKLAGLCDRVVMPLPKGGEHFLREAIGCIKPLGGIVHFYDFVDKKDMFSKTIGKIKSAARECGRAATILGKKKVRDFSPQTVQVVIDFLVK